MRLKIVTVTNERVRKTGRENERVQKQEKKIDREKWKVLIRLGSFIFSQLALEKSASVKHNSCYRWLIVFATWSII